MLYNVIGVIDRRHDTRMFIYTRKQLLYVTLVFVWFYKTVLLVTIHACILLTFISRIWSFHGVHKKVPFIVCCTGLPELRFGMYYCVRDKALLGCQSDWPSFTLHYNNTALHRHLLSNVSAVSNVCVYFTRNE